MKMNINEGLPQICFLQQALKFEELFAHVHLSGDFGGEVFLLLLDALAPLEADEGLDGDLAAQLLGDGGHVLLHGDAPSP